MAASVTMRARNVAPISPMRAMPKRGGLVGAFGSCGAATSVNWSAVPILIAAAFTSASMRLLLSCSYSRRAVVASRFQRRDLRLYSVKLGLQLNYGRSPADRLRVALLPRCDPGFGVLNCSLQ